MENQTNLTATPAMSWLWWVSPSQRVCVLALGGLLAEVGVLNCAPDGIYQLGGMMPVLATLSLAWIWFTWAWVFEAVTWAARSWLRHRSPWAKLAAWSVAFISVPCTVVYLASWVFYLQAGRFIGLQILIRIIMDGHALWQYLVEAQWGDILTFASMGLVALTGLLVLIQRLRRSEAMLRRSRTDRLCRVRRIIWCTFTLLVLSVLRPVMLDASDLRRGPRVDAMKLQLNPVFTLMATCLDCLIEEKVDACLDCSKLQPIGRGAGKDGGFVDTDRPSIVFVVIESLRQDVVYLRHQGREVMPQLNALARSGLQLTRAYSQSTHTDYAEPCIVSSLYPLRTRRHCYYRTSDRWPKTLIYDILKPAGYATAIISSENLAWGSMDQLLESPGLDFVYEAERSGAPTQVSKQDGGLAFETRHGPLRAGKLDDAFTTDRAIRWIADRGARGRPLFLYVDFQSSHFPYPIPPNAPRPFQPCELGSDATFLHYPVEVTETVRNAYYNALQEVDRQLERLVEALAKQGVLDHAILVVTGDHGESFHENGRVTHAREPFEPVVRVPCIVHAPADLAAGVDDYPTQHIDLAPTVLGLMGCAPHPNFQGINVLAPDRPPPDERLLFFHAENGLARVDALLLGGRWKLMQNRRTQQHALFDLAADPGETNDVSGAYQEMTVRLLSVLHAWRRGQLAYYHYPQYYLRFYPPAAPKLGRENQIAGPLASR